MAVRQIILMIIWQLKFRINLSTQHLAKIFPTHLIIHNVNYTLPEQYSSAKMIVVDKSGKVLKEINISGSGRGSLNIDASMLASGAYQYSLYVDANLIDTKQMEHIR